MLYPLHLFAALHVTQLILIFTFSISGFMLLKNLEDSSILSHFEIIYSKSLHVPPKRNMYVLDIKTRESWWVYLKHVASNANVIFVLNPG